MWTKHQPLTVIRFLGTSADSSSLIPLLTSLCHQISLHHSLPLDAVPTEPLPIINFFSSLMSRASTCHCPLLIFLDSLDMLSPADGAHLLAWFPASLPPHCKLVASVVTSHDVIVRRLRSLTQNILYVDDMGTELAIRVVNGWLTNAGRTVTADQLDIIQSALRK